MPTYSAPREDIQFVLHELLGDVPLHTLPGFEDATPDLVDQVIEAAATFCEEELQPLNLPGDAEGCAFENGVVRTPKGFKEAYTAYCEAGWPGLSANPDHGGQGLPQTLGFALQEMLNGANMAFAMYPGLSYGAMEALERWGTDEQKRLYLPKLVEGTWSGTMCLTEPHCGTDLGLIRTKAEPNDDGSYAVSGTKIFISAGEHDLTENIVHLVLAKLPDAPEGVRGISLFVVPKFLPKDLGTDVVPGPRNGATCASIEHKMGIKASATCVMNFDGATGWLVGEPHKGLRAMFTMMNAARLGVGLQGLGLADVAYQNAASYAKDRRQGRALGGAVEPDQPADSILVHPDVRRELLTVRAFTEGARALALHTARAIDIAETHTDAAVRQDADEYVQLMTPIIKAYFTDEGFAATVRAQQVFGGHGYIHEYGMEQFVRDARIAMIYEGANGIQALDLVGRKLPKDFGRLLRHFFHPTSALLEEAQDDTDLQEFVFPLAKAFGKLQQATALIAQRGLSDPEEAGAVAADYLRLFALVALGAMWLRTVRVANQAIADGANGKGPFYETKVQTARFFFQKILPETSALFITIMAGKAPLMDVEAAAF